ncbi:3-oxoacyl-[acyl-carrier-protein] synthase III C-terminal domain-containing protein [uncultured Mailhella sp.]|uniref:3-oxoacyl-[acyl-carrier-protein] synthase III C-terminal domain-containing protein n=1 Tax=uncultured Mailhella sp. TaxID=1981031 RepID=UPI00263005A2|nr:3-oxoacyl-[acyl-carrier-protein] synthase III C-terminal domain-containing protein [uncultured Mailhella sp.]
MKATIHGVKIRGVCATVPAHVSYFEDELKHFPFPEKSSRRLGKVMGFREHRIADPKTTLCDLASYTLNYLFHRGYLRKEDMQAMIVVSRERDYPVPGNSKVIHGQLGLPRDMHCVDMYENCIGFISGLYTACSMIAGGGVDSVVLATTITGACYANIKDRNTYPICGDAAGVTLITRSDDPEDKISFVFHHDGSRLEVLMTPAGGMRMPRSSETAKMFKDKMGNFRSLNNKYMDGTAVFQFVMEEVPPLIEEICAYAGVKKEDIRYHLTHQPNRFMLEKLADLMGVSRDILFNNIVEKFGNSSCATIPVNIAFNLGKRLLAEKMLVCFSAFGAGLSLGAAVCPLGNLEFCDLIEHPGNGVIEYTD